MNSKKKSSETESIHYLSVHEAFEKNQASRQPKWLRSIQSEAIEAFRSQGFPTLRSEQWKYTDVRPIAAGLFQPNFATPNGQIGKQQIEPFLFADLNESLLVFVDGIFSEELSSPGRFADGIVLCNLQKALRENEEVVRTYLGKQAGVKDDAFTALNTAFVYDGFFLYLPTGVEMGKPVHVLFITSAKSKQFLIQPRNLIVAESSSRATILESHISLAGENYLLNPVTEIFLNENAELAYSRIERENTIGYHIASSYVVQQKSSRFRNAAMTFGSKISRNSVRVLLEGESVECDLSGLYVTRHDEHVDNVTFIKHDKPHGTSHQLYKGLLDDKSTSIFSGKVFVEKGAAKTDARQTNKNLLLSENATANTRPQLEIFADDVKCTHGAAVGHLDEEAVFYLKSRGIDGSKAQRILTMGFASEVIDRLSLDPVRKEMERLVRERLDTSIFAQP